MGAYNFSRLSFNLVSMLCDAMCRNADLTNNTPLYLILSQQQVTQNCESIHFSCFHIVPTHSIAQRGNDGTT
jgi:hypothetical protein